MIKYIIYLTITIPTLSFALPTCIKDKFENNFQNITNFTQINSRNSNSDIFSIIIQNAMQSEHPYKIAIINEACDILYSIDFDDHPMSLFLLSDIGDLIYSIWISANSYILNIIYINEAGEIKSALTEYTKTPPSFIFNNSKNIPIIKLKINDGFKIYEFSDFKYKLSIQKKKQKSIFKK